MENNGARICFEGRSQTINRLSICKDLNEKKRTEHCRMQAVSEGDQDRGGQYDQENMAKEEV